MKQLYILLVLALVIVLPYHVQSQIPVANPAGTTVTIYEAGSPPNILSTTTTSDSREIAFTGVVYAFSNTSWPSCTNWGIPTSNIDLVNGSSSNGCSPPNYSSVGLTNVTGNVATFSGNTNYNAYTAIGLNQYNIPIQLVITIVNNSGTAIPIQQVNGFIYIPIPQGNYAFRVMVQIQAQGPSSSSAPFANYSTSGTGTTNTSSYTCADYSGQWVGAIQLYNCVHTVSAEQICTTYPGTTNNYQFLNGTSACSPPLSTSGQSATSETVQFCQDGTISFNVTKGGCSAWSAELLNNNYTPTGKTWPVTGTNGTVSWTSINPGTYHAIVIDQTGTCAQRLDFTINAGAPCHININNPDFSPPSVAGCDDASINASIDAFVCGNTWNATLYDNLDNIVNTWSPPTSAILWNNLVSGNYRIAVTSNSPCNQEANVPVTAGPPCRVEIQNVQTTINNCDTNTITADLSTLTCDNVWYAYLYSSNYNTILKNWNNTQTASIVWTDIPLGSYHIVATDFGVCNDTVNVTLTCSDDDPCTLDFCGGSCHHTFKCEDNNPCTEDFCQPGGVCQNQPIICDDGNLCTNDACVGGTCQNNPVNCADNNACTVDQCFNGNCTHSPMVCNDNSSCTNDFCSAGNCIYQPTCLLDDNNPCTDDHCVNRTCLHVQKNCDDANTCTSDACVGGLCVNTPICVFDDGDPCTQDQCLNGTCAHIPINCNDNNSCTSDRCANGVCVNSEICTVDDGNPCTIDACLSGQCLHNPINCSDNDPCTADACDTTGTCTHSACPDDNDPCTIDTCISGQCVHEAIDCDDNDACTIDTCDQNSDCVNEPLCPADNNLCTTDLCILGQCLSIPTDCDDDDLCTTDDCDSLNTGNCLYEAACVVDDGNNCTLDFCDNGVCHHQYSCPCAADSTCNDNDACTLDSCIASACSYTSSVNCNDANSCTDDYCINGTCVHDSLSCNDQDLCTIDSCVNGSCLHSSRDCDDVDLCTTDTCAGGFCISAPINCNDGDVCTTDSCNGGACVHVTVLCPDNDNNACTSNVCVNGQCTSDTLNCDDNDLCTIDHCDTLSGCIHAPKCNNNDNDPCTNDTCISGQCLNLALECNDSISCTNDFCDNGFCVFEATCPLHDGDPCTNDTCISGGCIYIPKSCDDSVTCTIDFCDSLGNCINDPTCLLDDGDPCTIDGCANGDCVHVPKNCNDQNDCTEDACQNGTCVFTALCLLNDGDPCTNDFCISGQCIHQSIFCNDGVLCTIDACDSTGNCTYTPKTCDDGNPCTTDTCRNGSCIYAPIPNCNDPCDVMVCTDLDPCTIDSCISAACAYPPINCNDNDPCTTDSCNNGNCGHSVIANCNLTISGTILTEMGAPVRSVTVKLTGTRNHILTTGTNGQFSFGVVQGDSSTVTPTKSNDTIVNNGVSTLDLILIQRQILAVTPLSSPYKKIAADVNNSYTVSTLDIILIRAVILAVAQSFPNGRLWAFVPSDFPFTDPPFPFDNFRTYPNMTVSQVNQNFIGMKLGDVNNSYNPNIAKLETVGEVQFAMDDYDAKPGDEIMVPVKVRDFKKVTGFQFTLSWNPEVLQLLEVNNKSLEGFYGMSAVNDGFLTTSWYDEMTRDITLADDEAVFDMKFKVTGTAGASSDIAIGSQLTGTEAYNQNLDLLSIVPQNGRVKVGEGSGITATPDSYHLRVQPNPFGNTTNIIFSLPKDETVHIIIYDLLGKEIKHILGQFEAGQHSIEWTGDDDAGKSLGQGLYHVRMITANEAQGVKVLLVR